MPSKPPHPTVAPIPPSDQNGHQAEQNKACLNVAIVLMVGSVAMVSTVAIAVLTMYRVPIPEILSYCAVSSLSALVTLLVPVRK